jgi:VCBS repeat-containing protein
VTAVNDASTIASLSGDSLAYSEGAGAVVIEQGANALVADVDSTNFDTGTLTVSIPAGGDSAEDVLSIRNQGTGAGQIGVSGSTVTYGGITIGTFTGGSSGSNLVITLNSSATPTAVTALVRNITYQNTDTNAPTTGARTVRFVLTDGDGGTSPNYNTTVTVSAVNDAPVLADTALSLTVAEDAGVPSGAVGSLISTFTGGITDVDSGASKGLAITGSNQTNGIWYYTRNGGTTWTAVGTVSNTSALLLADNGSTRLYFAPNANYHGTSSAALTVRAWDQTSGTAGTKVSTASTGGTTAFSSATDTVDVTVTAVNDAPTDLSLSANTVEENAANGTLVGIVTGTDPDTGDTQTYSLTNTAGGRFAINSATGEITVADGTLLDYESATSHSVTVRVTDAGGLTYDETFTINLTNVNETPTDLSLSANTVAENASNGTLVGTVTGTDPDTGDTQTYSLTNTAGGRFAINSATGEITVADGSLLNYEAATNHSVTVRVTDSGGLTYDETFTINLTNVNETPSSTGQQSNTVIALLGAANPVAPAVERANTISEVEVRPLDDMGMSIEVRPEPSFIVDAIMTPAKERPHLAHTAVVERAAILGGKQNLPTSSDKREGIAVNLDATGNQDVVRLGSHNPTVQHAEEMETTSDESSRLDMPMAAGLAGMMLLHGNTGMKDRMTVMSRRIRGLPQRPPSDTKPGESNVDQEGSIPQESGNDRKLSNKSDQS